MIEPSVAYGAEGVHAWFRKHTLKLVAAGCLALGVFAFGSDEADAMADSDGYVPVYYSCWAGSSVGLYSWYYDGYTVTGTVTVNSCVLDGMGAGPGDYQRVIDHEMGHAQGYGHSGDPYSAMHPTVTINGSRRRYCTIRHPGKPWK